jgi:hypothetical protein
MLRTRGLYEIVTKELAALWRCIDSSTTARDLRPIKKFLPSKRYVCWVLTPVTLVTQEDTGLKPALGTKTLS